MISTPVSSTFIAQLNFLACADPKEPCVLPSMYEHIQDVRFTYFVERQHPTEYIAAYQVPILGCDAIFPLVAPCEHLTQTIWQPQSRKLHLEIVRYGHAIEVDILSIRA